MIIVRNVKINLQNVQIVSKIKIKFLKMIGDPQNVCICKNGYFEESKNVCKPCNEECLTCSETDKCTKCKGQFRKVSKDGKCDCIEGFEEVIGDINCKKPPKPVIVIPIKEKEEEGVEACIIIKKRQSESEINKEKSSAANLNLS